MLRLVQNSSRKAGILSRFTPRRRCDRVRVVRLQLHCAAQPFYCLAVIGQLDLRQRKPVVAFSEAQVILKAFPTAKLIMAIAAPAVPGAAEAVQQSGRKDVFVIGLSLPNLCKKYVHDGVVQAVVLWNTRDLGYLTVYTSMLLAQNKMQAGAESLQAGRLGRIEIRGSEVILGQPVIFNKANIDQFDF